MKRWLIKFRHKGNTQKKAYNIQNMAKVWNQEELQSVNHVWNCWWMQRNFDFLFADNAFFLTLCIFCSLPVNYLKNCVTLEPVLQFPHVFVFHEFVFHSTNSRQQKFAQLYANILLFEDIQRNTSSVLIILRACLCNVGIHLHTKCLNILWQRWLSLRQTCHCMYIILLGWL